MNRKIKIGSPKPKPPQVPSSAQPPIDMWEPPFERWIRLADDLLRDWPHPPANTREHRI